VPGRHASLPNPLAGACALSTIITLDFPKSEFLNFFFKEDEGQQRKDTAGCLRAGGTRLFFSFAWRVSVI
jgi:hypothetical protein